MRRKFLINNEAVVSGPVLKLLIIVAFILVVVGVASFISLVWGIFAFIGICLLVGAAFILFIKKGNVSFKPSFRVDSAFMWLIIIGIVLVVISPVIGQFFGNPTIDFSIIPGTKLLSMNLLGSTCGTC